MTQKKLKEGAIKRYKSALLGANWKDCYAYLFSDSTFVWYQKKGDTKPLGSVVLKFVAPYVCAGEMTLKMPIERPSLPSKASLEQLLAIGKNAKAEDVLWFLFPDSDLEVWVEEMLKTVPKVNPPNEVLQGGTIESQPGVTTVIEKHYDHGGYYSGWNGFGHGYFPNQDTTVNNYNNYPDSNNTPILPNDGRDSGLGGDAKTESDDNNSKADEGGGGDFGSDNNDIHIGAVSDPHHAEKPTGVPNESDNSKADEGGGGDFSSDNNDTHVGAVSDPHHAEKPEENTRAPDDPNVHAENTNPFTDSDDKNPFDDSDEINTGHVTHTVEQSNVTHTVEQSGGTAEISHSAGNTGGDHSGGNHSGGHSDENHSGGHSGEHHHADDVHHS
uniref:PH domain-containing protein n=1 Tax=Acrobeloides nanus TaxID=290746 RepID=A0A914CC72_9BILA